MKPELDKPVKPVRAKRRKRKKPVLTPEQVRHDRKPYTPGRVSSDEDANVSKQFWGKKKK